MRYGVEIMKIPPLLLIVNFRLSRSSTHRILNLIKAEPEPMIYNQNGRLFPSLLYLYKDVYLEVKISVSKSHYCLSHYLQS